MWTASENYQEDLRISKNILRQLVDNYRRIRNTCRFILGNLNDFDHREHGVRFEHMQPVDRYIVQLLADKHHGMMQAYGSYELHKVFHSLHNACVNELSSFYLDIIKDRLYVLPESSLERRSAQTALYHIIYLLLQDMAPILSFTAEEAYQHLPQPLRGESETIFGLPQQEYGPVMSAQERRLWDRLLQIRSEVTRAIEPQRKEGIVGHSLDCRVTLYAGPDMFQELNEALPSLRELFIVSQVNLAPLDSMPDTAFRSEAISGLGIGISFAAGDKCARCWNYSERLGENVAYPEACPRCSDILEGLKQNMASK
jgi:isoleucyl-tRNA synthetase